MNEQFLQDIFIRSVSQWQFKINPPPPITNFVHGAVIQGITSYYISLINQTTL